ncbi:MAG: hypothetical protein ACRDVC_05750 [Acidimicrobiales bacterium]
MFEASMATLLIALALCIGVGLPVWAVRSQKPKLQDRELPAEVDHQRESRR